MQHHHPSLYPTCGSAIWIICHHSVRSRHMFSMRLKYNMPFLIVSCQLFLCLPFPLLIWVKNSLFSTLLTAASRGFLCTCLNHLKRVSLIFSSIGATRTFLLMHSLVILSSLMCPNVSAHPSQHSHFCYPHFLFMFTLSHLTLIHKASLVL